MGVDVITGAARSRASRSGWATLAGCCPKRISNLTACLARKAPRGLWICALAIGGPSMGVAGCSSVDGSREARVTSVSPGTNAPAGDGETMSISGGDSQSAGPSQPVSMLPGGPQAPQPGTSSTSMREPVRVDDCGANNPAGLGADAVQSLMAGGDAGAMRWLYPYEGTVFPRGMRPPTLMWEGAPGDVVYLHLSAGLFDYRGCLPVTGPQQLELPESVWLQAGEQTTGPADPYTIELVVQGAGGPIGPIVEQIVIAQATLKGSIYYNSYVSAGSALGSVYRIPPGGEAQVFLGGGLGCYGCHAVAADGSRLLSHTGGDPGASYALSPTTQPNPPILSPALGAGFAGLSPDGSVYVATAHPAGAVRPQGTPLEAIIINDAALYETDTGTLVANSGIPAGAMMSMFSPDGTRVAFNDFGAGAGRALAVMDYDPAARTLSGHKVVFTDSNRYPGWPFFLPDNRALIFARGDNPAFSGAGAGVIPGLPTPAPQSDLYIVDVESGTSTVLARAMGMKAADDASSATPFGDVDLHKHFYPTVSPVAAGGYFWVFFDSIRTYGNQGAGRQLWGSAVAIAPDGKYESDPSHPAFYVTGQAFGSGNHRAFAALDPCKADGESCETGIDCCGGFCTDGVCGPPEQGRCSETNEACQMDSDCCNSGDYCLNGFCAQVILK